MDTYGWLESFVPIAFTLVPFFATWATALLWRRSRAHWALAALAGSLLMVAGVAGMWLGFLIHYSSGATMHAENEHPQVLRQAIIEGLLSVGSLISSLSLVGYARTRGKNDQG